MQAPLRSVIVVMRRVPLVNRWVDEKWELARVEVDEGRDGDGTPGPVRAERLAANTWRWSGFTVDLHPSEAEGYWLNLGAPDPRVFVMWRLEEWEGEPCARPWVTTLGYHEAARMMDAGETVESVPIPAVLRDWAAPWVEANYKPEPRRKQKRNERFWRGEGGGTGGGRSGPPAAAAPEDSAS